MIRNHFFAWSRFADFSFICFLYFFLQLCTASTKPAINFPFAEADFSGTWTASLECPGGNIEFELELMLVKGQYSGFVINGHERIRIDSIKSENEKLQIAFPHYDSAINASLVNKNKLTGNWTKVVGKNKTDKLTFRATRGKRSYLLKESKHLSGRYQVKFESSDDLAVGILDAKPDFIAGTFLTTTGDYRFLAGSFDKDKNELTLSCFDGGHAFLFKAEVTKDVKLRGDFWSRNSWHEKWTGSKNANVELDDGFEQVQWAGVKTSTLRFPNLNGKLKSLNDEDFKGKIKILQIFGSWCPNCHDASQLLNELKNKYEKKGLTIVGLAFELTGDFDRDREQILRYKKRTGANYPILVAGIADKAEATKQLRILSKVKSYPTTIFLNKDDKPIAIHSGFSGPATGDAYLNLKRRFQKIIEKQLSED